jgi:transmembrane sensor
MTTISDIGAPQPDVANERAAQEAMDWLVLLQEGTADADQRARFQSWLAADARNESAWADVSGLYAMLGDTPPRHEAHWRKPDPAFLAAPRRAPIRRRGVIALLTAASVALVTFVGLFPDWRHRLTADASTGIAELRQLPLADGSVVHLGPGSAIDVDLDARTRRITLLSGAAYFDVAPDAERPFTVEVAGVAVRALGTAFEVDEGADGVRIALEHGRVRITHGGQVSDLAPGEWQTISPGGTVQSGAIAANQIAAWRRGQLVARDRSVADVVDELRRSYRGIIVLRDETLARKRLTGAYNLADPADVLAAIARTHQAKVTQISPWVMVLEPLENP